MTLCASLILQTKSGRLLVPACWQGDGAEAGGRRSFTALSSLVWLCFQRVPTDRAREPSCLFPAVLLTRPMPESSFQQDFLSGGWKRLERALGWDGEPSAVRRPRQPPQSGHVGDVCFQPLGFCSCPDSSVRWAHPLSACLAQRPCLCCSSVLCQQVPRWHVWRRGWETPLRTSRPAVFPHVGLRVAP